MKLSDLKLGDLIFYKNNRMDIIEHVAMFLCIKDDVPYVIHATTEPYNSVMVTRLKTDDFESYCIVRAKNQNLSIEALAIVLSWVEFQVPYASTTKLDILNHLSEREYGINFDSSSSAELQSKFGLIASIEINAKKDKIQHHYLDMLEALPYVTTHYEKNGFRCAEVIALAYNLALLKMSSIAVIDSPANPFPFDSEKALAAGLFYFCTKSPNHWSDLGILDKNDIHNTSIKIPKMSSDADISKAAWVKFIKELRDHAKHLIENYYSERVRSRTVSYSSYSSKSTESFCSSPNLSRQSPIRYYFMPESPNMAQEKYNKIFDDLETRCGSKENIRSETSSFSFFTTDNNEKKYDSNSSFKYK